MKRGMVKAVGAVAGLVILLATAGCVGIDAKWLAAAKEKYEVKYHLKKAAVSVETGAAEIQNNKVHPPYGDRECDKCHLPDQGSKLRGQGAEFCFLCHQRKEFDRERLHGPVAAGDCSTCHSSHQSPYPFHTTAGLPQLCLKCHEAEWWDSESGKGGVKAGYVVHRPVAEGKCPECHDPHGATERYFLKASGAELCLKCHDRQKYGEGALHGPLAIGDCLICHQPHAARGQRLLRVAKAEELCRGCHQGELTGCGPDAKGKDCVECHSPHQSGQQVKAGVR